VQNVKDWLNISHKKLE